MSLLAASAVLLILALQPGCAHRGASLRSAPHSVRQSQEAEEHVAVVPMNLRDVLQRVDEILDGVGIEHSSFGSLACVIAVHDGRGWEARARLCADPVTRAWVVPVSLRPQD